MKRAAVFKSCSAKASLSQHARRRQERPASVGWLGRSRDLLRGQSPGWGWDTGVHPTGDAGGCRSRRRQSVALSLTVPGDDMCDALALVKRLQTVWHQDSSSEGNVSSLSYMCVKLGSSQAFAGDGASWGV